MIGRRRTTRRPLSFASLGAFLSMSAVLVAPAARADDDPSAATPPTQARFERRGVRRAGIALFTAGVSALPSSLAFYLTTDRAIGPEAAAMAITGHLLMGAGIPMWVVGAQGRRTHPRNAALMYTGMVIAGFGFVGLPASSAAVVSSFQSGIGDDAAARRRTAAIALGASANGLLVIGIPMWALGAASPDDRYALAPCASGLCGRF